MTSFSEANLNRIVLLALHRPGRGSHRATMPTNKGLPMKLNTAIIIAAMLATAAPASAFISNSPGGQTANNADRNGGYSANRTGPGNTVGSNWGTRPMPRPDYLNQPKEGPKTSASAPSVSATDRLASELRKKETLSKRESITSANRILDRAIRNGISIRAAAKQEAQQEKRREAARAEARQEKRREAARAAKRAAKKPSGK